MRATKREREGLLPGFVPGRVCAVFAWFCTQPQILLLAFYMYVATHAIKVMQTVTKGFARSWACISALAFKVYNIIVESLLLFLLITMQRRK